MQSAPNNDLHTVIVGESPIPPFRNQHGPSTIPDLAQDGRGSGADDDVEPGHNDQLSADNLLSATPASIATAADNASVTSSTRGRSHGLNLRRMSSAAQSQESSPGSRIDAYERANVVPRRPSEDMLFQVMPSSNPTGTSVLDMPNEVLTHILSHLPPESLSLMSLVNSRFHRLVTTPPAWRIAFARFFPGPESTGLLATPSLDSPSQRSQRRAFTRVSALASWRSEYILRTRLLRSLGRGRPAIQLVSEKGQKGKAAATATVSYNSGLMYPASHMHAFFGSGLNKKRPQFVHGAVEQGTVTASDPTAGKASGWGLADFEAFKHFADLYTGEAPYGLGSGDLVGMTNVMDVSHWFGKLYGEACPGGRLFYTSTSEQRGRFLMVSSFADFTRGIPDVSPLNQALTAVWLAKSENVLKVTGGLFGALAGSSIGVLSAYAVGQSPVYDSRFAKGELTARWAICPGVPIVAISVDDKVSARRIGRRRIWAALVNALGEVYYLIDTPRRADVKGKLSEVEIDRLAWQTGRSAEWVMLESTRRTAKPDPFQLSIIDGSYSPKSSSDKQGLSPTQLEAEAREITEFLKHKPKYFQSICDGWDMCRSLIVDYAGDDHHAGGETIVVLTHGKEEHLPASVRRYTRRQTKVATNYDADAYPAISQHGSLSCNAQRSSMLSSPDYSVPRSRTSSAEDLGNTLFSTEWFVTDFAFGLFKGVEITVGAVDESDFAVLAASEDPLLGMSGGSDVSSPVASPLGAKATVTSASEIPGQRARLFGVGTAAGNVVLWDLRAATSMAADVVNTIYPVRLIYTRSPGISSLALTSLYVVHGGTDGLVQAWDPLASSMEPIRTLNSRFSDRARRRMAQAEVSVHGVGINYYAAGAIALDSDPTMLRGMVTLGTHLKYWSFSAGAADAYKSRKRGQLRRRSDRGSNSGTVEKYHHTGRGVLRDYMEDERMELEREKTAKHKEAERLMTRFGTNLLGENASEEEMLAYAAMLSEEAYASDEVKRQTTPPRQVTESQPEMDADLEEAIRLSLLETEAAYESPQTTDFAIPIRYGKKSKQNTPSKTTGGASSSTWTRRESQDDVDFALQLSLAEQESLRLTSEQDVEGEDFPALSKPTLGSSPTDWQGKGKGKQWSGWD